MVPSTLLGIISIIARGWQTFSVKDWILNILSFADLTDQVGYHSMKADRDDM